MGGNISQSSWDEDVSGVLIPGILIIRLGVLYLLSGDPVQIDLSLSEANLIPDMSNISSIVSLAGFIFVFAGIEVSAAHANEVKNPQRNYPIAIFIAGLILFIINVFGAMAVAIVVPQKQISLIAGWFYRGMVREQQLFPLCRQDIRHPCNHDPQRVLCSI